ncbi:MAG: type IV pilus assembly protein PilM [Planctomycetaceae bacterium]
MAESQGVWGIEIGQAALKAIRLRYAEAAGQCIAVAFDYIPHPKILSQPDANPDELIAQALATFLSRNDLKGDRVAISVPGQSALARFIKLPPVEAGKVDEIVKYEARQQIPFDLNDVIWDYQSLSGAQEEGGLMLDAEVGLFAMKRDQVLNALRPFNDARVEVDLVQVAPLALYNYLAYDRLGMRVGDDFTPSSEHHIVVDMGADNTTLLVSNGAKIWLRNVPIGGNHFTRALTKEMKLTFAKAEHLKCNATKSPDPRAVFQALRPVFNDYVSEIQRSVGYFSSVNRDAKIKMVLGLGNGFKLAGLQKFLQQHLQYPVEKVESFKAAVGDNVLGAPLFQENILGFAVPYGLALQLLKVTQLRTSLLPPEIATARTIRRKKPWAVASAATLLFALGVSAAGASVAWQSASPDRWNGAAQAADGLKSAVDGTGGQYTTAKGAYEQMTAKENKLLEPVEYRENWPALFAAINASLPDDSANEIGRKDPRERKELNVRSITARKMDDVSVWFQELPGALASGTPDDSTFMMAQDRQNPAAGKGYVIAIEGFHFLQNSDYGKDDPLIHACRNLQSWEAAPGLPARKLGITHVAIVDLRPNEPIEIPDPAPPPEPDPAAPLDQPFMDERRIQVKHTKFKIEFIWRPTTKRQMAAFDALHTAYPTAGESAQLGFDEARTRTAEILQNENPHLRGLLRQEEFDEYMTRYVPKPAAATPAAAPTAGTPAPAPAS